VRGAKAAARGIPIIASVNCRGTARWAEFAAKIEAAGADALELNLAFMPISTEEQGLAIEELAFRTVREVRAVTRLPIAVKLGSSYTNLANVAVGLAEAGAGALVLFNRFYRMDLDLETMSLVSGPFHSSPEDYHESLRWVAILAERAGCDLAAGTGIHDAEVALRLVAAGAAAVQVCSAIYKGGWRALGDIKKGMSAWLDAKGIAELGALKGRLSQWRSAKPEAYLRVQYIKALTGIS
jgi:dihydroorotate dehydrogenase (fumarate)